MKKPLADRLDELAARVTQNGQRRLDPERFHAEKSDIAARIRECAREIRGDVRRAPSTSWKAGQ